MHPTGPRTPEGKAIASRNATKHGLLSDAPLATRFESAGEWQAHCEGILADLQPQGPAEACLAERAALLMWRLRRVALAEVEAVNLAYDSAEDDYLRAGPLSDPRGRPADLRTAAARAERLVALFAALPALADSSPVECDDAWALCEVAAEAVENDPEQDELTALDLLQQCDDEPWTAARLRDTLAGLASRGDCSPQSFAASVADRLDSECAETALTLEQAQQEIARLRRRRILPNEGELNKLSRYEAHLGRELARTMKALHDLQSRNHAASARQECETNSPAPRPPTPPESSTSSTPSDPPNGRPSPPAAPVTTPQNFETNPSPNHPARSINEPASLDSHPSPRRGGAGGGVAHDPNLRNELPAYGLAAVPTALPRGLHLPAGEPAPPATRGEGGAS